MFAPSLVQDDEAVTTTGGTFPTLSSCIQWSCLTHRPLPGVAVHTRVEDAAELTFGSPVGWGSEP